MPNQANPVTTTQFAKKEDRTIETGGHPVDMSNEQHEEQAQKISVRALRTFHEGENMHGRMVQPGEEFQCPRGRAAQLRANGLIEYTDASDAAKLHGDEGAKKLDERVKREQEQTKIPDKYKTTPLRNPELKLADVSEDKASKK